MLFDAAKIIINILIHKYLRLFNPVVGRFSFLQLAVFRSYSWPIFVPTVDYRIIGIGHPLNTTEFPASESRSSDPSFAYVLEGKQSKVAYVLEKSVFFNRTGHVISLGL